MHADNSTLPGRRELTRRQTRLALITAALRLAGDPLEDCAAVADAVVRVALIRWAGSGTPGR